MTELNLIKVDAKPIEKLIDVISKGIGTIYRPKAIRKEADAKAYEIEIIERAKAKALAEGKEIEADTYDKIQERLLYKETKRQQNIDNISQIAAEQISQEQTVSDELVDEDWTTRFFDIVEDVSDEEMQQLWGRILAGEVKRPKSYSLRTLELLKNLTKHEAAIFMKVANFAIKSDDDENYIFKGNNDTLSENYGITYMDISLLKEIGLIQPSDFVIHKFLQQTADIERILTAGTIQIFVKIKANTPTLDMPVYVLSTTGNELLNLIKPIPNFNYLRYFANSIRNENIEVKYTNISAREETNIRHTPLLDF